MNENAETKICPHCAETIKAAAKVCPHCRYWQKRWSIHNPQILATAWIACCIAVMSVVGIFFDRMINPKERFPTYREDIAVVSSQLSHRIGDSNLMNTVVGMLTNHGNFGWMEIGVEAQFFDKSGKEIDAITAKAEDYRGFVILPHGEVAFKIEGVAARLEADYDTYKVKVRWAKDVGTWP
jgi:hypothetical protein